MKGHDCRQAGFTLIELLITITIVVLVTGSAIAAYIAFNETRQLDVDARTFLSTLSRVRSKSVFLEYPADCSGLVSFNFESLVGTSGTLDSVYSYAVCSEGIRGEETVKILESSVFLAGFSISFLPSSGAISSGQDLEVTISSVKGVQRSKTIIVNQMLNNVNRVIDN